MNYKKVSKWFYMQPCLRVAKELIGKVLVRRKGKKVYSGIIVETEAYTGFKDAASHSYRGMTKRNEVMFGPGGYGYVYFTYGNHYCFNVVTEKEGTPHAVLIRALEPVEGIKHMIVNRGTKNVYNLASGPGKLAQSMEIDLGLNGVNLRGDKLFIAEAEFAVKYKIVRSKRIGITKNPDKFYRFSAKDNPFVSRTNVSKILKSTGSAERKKS